jgi:cellulose synthase/poly-beta-1,6-N-acetylglucosamine synthase-like glycosyltransferase
MSISTGVKDLSVIGLELPRFAQFVRQVVKLRSDQLKACLEQQHRAGGRLEEILRRQGLLSPEQLAQILKNQARWVATAMQADMAPSTFPYPAFLSLCLPAYNEQENIEDTLDAACAILPEFVERFEIVVVNDGSTDRTGVLVADYARREPRVRLINHAGNRGYGVAVTSGLRAAVGDLIAFIDSDGQFSLLDLPRLLALLDDECDVAIGYRQQRADRFHRRLNAWGWNWLVRLLLGVWVTDMDCAFKVFRRHAVDQLGPLTGGAAFNADLLSQCLDHGMRIRESPVAHYPRDHGVPTGARLKVIIRAFGELARLWWRSRIIVRAPVNSTRKCPLSPYSRSDCRW